MIFKPLIQQLRDLDVEWSAINAEFFLDADELHHEETDQGFYTTGDIAPDTTTFFEHLRNRPTEPAPSITKDTIQKAAVLLKVDPAKLEKALLVELGKNYGMACHDRDEAGARAAIDKINAISPDFAIALLKADMSVGGADSARNWLQTSDDPVAKQWRDMQPRNK